MLRTLAERLSRNVVLRKRLPRDLGGHFIYVTPESALSFWYPGLERADNGHLMDTVRRFVARDCVVWDIGANVGLFSFAAASKAGIVLAIEPDPWLAALLNRSASSSTNVRVLCAAVSDIMDLGNLNIAQRGRSTNFINGFGTSQTGGVRNRQPVVTVTLDWLAERLPVPDIIKIDVEAGERLVFEGAKGLFNRTKPHLVCEVASVNSSWVTDFLLSLGYSFLDEYMKPTSHAIDNIVAVPCCL
ncbi:MAG TPA: FkbM family methyltransferase [Candidatus Sulfotelmatobacter sp.]|nr:FkbM family methyltransferase [Candidatus Sulfotelmatobacter sp.]